MEQHPVPQNISSYEFRLVGEMTLKQFFQLAGGAGVGSVVYKLPLPFFLKWPIVGLAVLTGIMLAFVPVGGRPFSQWLMAFFRAVYSPTNYSWLYTPAVSTNTTAASNVPLKPKSALDKIEDQVLGRVSQFFSQTKAVPVVTTPTVPAFSQPITPEPKPVFQEPIVEKPVAKATETTFVKSDNIPHKPLVVAEIVDAPQPASQPATPPPPPQPLYVAPEPTKLSPTVSHEPDTTAVPVVVTKNLPMPERPNIVSGQVLDHNELPVEGAIVEISQAKTGIPVRALRANKLGQFQTATPLNIGNYVISAEKDSLTFGRYSLEIQDKIVPPIVIGASA